MAEHKIQSTSAADNVKTKDVETEALPKEEEFDNFDSTPTVPRSKRLVINLYTPFPVFVVECNSIHCFCYKPNLISLQRSSPQIIEKPRR